MSDRCWLNWPYYTLSKFAITWVWSLFFVALRMKSRVAWLALAVPVLVFWAAGAVDGQHSATLSVTAVGRIRQLHQAMADYKAQHQNFPATLPNTAPRSRIDEYYAFELKPSRAVDRQVVDYLIQATPYHRPCRAMLSFAIASDGRIFNTREPRPATEKDEVLE
jgi:hypothetical protein